MTVKTQQEETTCCVLQDPTTHTILAVQNVKPGSIVLSQLVVIDQLQLTALMEHGHLQEPLSVSYASQDSTAMPKTTQFRAIQDSTT